MTELNNHAELPEFQLASLFGPEAAGASGLPGGKSLKSEFTKVTQPSPIAHELVDKRMIRIVGVIDDEMATNVIAMMHFLEDLQPGVDIELRINSPGGSVTAGLAIYDAMRDLNCDVRTVCEGRAASMAAILLAAGTPGKRSATPNATVMVHGPSGGAEGTYPDMKRQMAEMERLRAAMIDLLGKHTGLTEQEITNAFDRDNYLSPADAKKYGLIDEIRQPRQPVLKAARPADAPPVATFRPEQSPGSPTVN
jgi:ATP-dependent Clp protease, protease subunit